MSCIKTGVLRCFVNNDTYKAKVITFPFDITDYEFLVQFRKDVIGVNENPVAFEWSTQVGDITVIDALEGKIQLGKKVISVDLGFYVGDVQAIKPNGDVETLFRLKQEVIQDYSRQ